MEYTKSLSAANSARTRCILVLLALLVLSITICLFAWAFANPFIYEAIDDPQYKIIIQTPEFYRTQHYLLFHLATFNILKSLSHAFPPINWFDIYLYSALVLAMCNTIVFLNRRSQFKTSGILLSALILIINFSSLWFIINSTRVSILLASSAIMLLLFLGGKRPGKFLLLYVLICLAIAFDLRVESGILGAGLGLVISGILAHQRSKYSYLYSALAIFVVALCFYYLSSAQNKSRTFKVYAQSEQAFFNIIDRNYLNPNLVLANSVDTLIFNEVTSAFFADKDVLTANKLGEISSSKNFIIGYHGNLNIFIKKLQRSIGSLIQSFYYEIMIVLLTMLCIWLILLADSQYRIFVKHLVAALFIMVVILLITWYFKMELRVLIPVLQILAICCWLDALDVVIKKGVKFYSLIFVSMCLLMVYEGNAIQNRIAVYIDYTKKQDEVMAQIKRSIPAKNVGVDLLSMELFMSRPFFSGRPSSSILPYPYDSPYIPIQSQMDEGSATINYYGFIKYLIENKKSIFLSDDNRMALLKKHLKIFYGKNLTITQLHSCYSYPANFISKDNISVCTYCLTID